MKKLIYSLVIIAGLAFVACKSEKKHDHNEGSHEMAKVEYVCPMECEGEKSYADKETKCPVCNMKLVAKKSEGKKEHDKDGENHGEKKEHDSDEKH